MSLHFASIEAADAHLDALREALDDAKEGQRGKWLVRIDAALDARLELMKARDGKEGVK